MSQDLEHASATVFKSSLGYFAVAWNGQAVAQLTFGHRSVKAALIAMGSPRRQAGKTCPDLQLLLRLQAYVDGSPEDFSDVAIDDAHLTPFSRRVVKACRAIPYGSTASYADLAKKAGSPKAARAVGQCMAKNRVPLIVPCHRVVAAGGRLGGFSAPGGVSLKQRLLDLENG